MVLLLEKKDELRKQALQTRKKMSETGEIKNASLVILKKILNSQLFKQAKNIALYFPIKAEIDLLPLLKIKDKNFYFPRCNNEKLEFVRFESYNKLTKGKYNIPEPVGNSINPEILDVIYTPALIANTSCYRLGYGRGYYDRFFSDKKIKAKKVIVISSKFINNSFVQDDFDIQCDELVYD